VDLRSKSKEVCFSDHQSRAAEMWGCFQGVVVSTSPDKNVGLIFPFDTFTSLKVHPPQNRPLWPWESCPQCVLALLQATFGFPVYLQSWIASLLLLLLLFRDVFFVPQRWISVLMAPTAVTRSSPGQRTPVCVNAGQATHSELTGKPARVSAFPVIAVISFFLFLMWFFIDSYITQ